MRLDRFTQSFQESIADAQSLALGRDHQFIEPIHLMMALLNQNGNSIIPLLKSAGIDVRTLRIEVEQALKSLAQVEDLPEMFNYLQRQVNCLIYVTNMPKKCQISIFLQKCFC